MKPRPNPLIAAAPPRLPSDPEPIRALFTGAEVYEGLGPDDLREMGKFTELPNAHGLPVHPIDWPADGDLIQEFPGTLAEFLAANSSSPLRRLRRLLGREPVLAVRGALAGGCARPFCVTAFVPQSQAHLAQAFQAMFWPQAEADAWRPSDLYIVQLPDTSEEGRRAFQLTLHLPGSKLALALGTDDPRPALLIAFEAASRFYTQRTRRIEEAGEEPKPEAIRLLPGGSFVLVGGEAGATLVFAGEAIPVSWEDSLVQAIPALAGVAPAAATLAGAEPWIAEGGGWVCPVWRNPPLSAPVLAAAGWEEAALDPDALPFGVWVDDAGQIRLGECLEDDFVVVPRAKIPSPFPRESARLKIGEHLTHRNAKPEAMELWARGFPAPKVI